MPGTNNMLIGLGIAILGGAVTGATYAIAPGGYFVVAYGAIFVGALQFVIGLGQWLFYAMKSPAKKAEHHLKVDVRVMLRSMLAMASADGELSESEIIMIEFISRSILGAPLPRRTIDSVFQEMRSEGYSISDEFSQIGNEVTPVGAELAIKAAAMVAMADGEFHAKEEEAITQMAGQLRVTGDRLMRCFHDARTMLDQMISTEEDEKSRASTP